MAEPDSREQDPAFQIGDRVEAQYRGRAKRYYKGEISAVHPDGGTFTYDINYDDGDRDRKLSGEFVRKLTIGTDSEKPSEKIVLSDLAEASLFKPSSDGSVIDSIIPNIIEVKSDKVDCVTDQDQKAPPSQAFAVGDRVEAKYKGRGTKYYRGIIKAIRPDGSFDVDYDDGDRDRRLSGDFIKRLTTSSSTNESPKPNSASTKQKMLKNVDAVQSSIASSIGSRGNSATSEAKTSTTGEGFKAGDTVEAIFRGRGSRWYKAIVTNRLPNGCYNVKYTAGDTDLRLPPDAVRAINRAESASKVVDSKPMESDSFQTDDGIGTECEGSGLSPIEMPAKDDASKLVQDESNRIIGAAEADNQSGVESLEEPPTSEDKTSIPNALAAEVSIDIVDSHNTEITESCQVKKQGRISKISIVHVYEVIYPDGSKDVDIPFEALRFDADSGRSGLNIGTCVDVTL